MRMKKHKVLVGQRFGAWTVMEDVVEVRHLPCGAPRYFALCRCDCGTEDRIDRGNLLAGMSKKCKRCRDKGAPGRPRKPAGWAALHKLYGQYQGGAVRRNINWNLTYDEFVELVAKPCHYCGVATSRTTSKYKDVLEHNGVDRVNSDGEYCLENCVPCCSRCNIAKHTMTKGEYLEHCLAVVRFSHVAA